MSRLQAAISAMQAACVAGALVWFAFAGNLGPLLFALIACRILANLRPTSRTVRGIAARL